MTRAVLLAFTLLTLGVSLAPRQGAVASASIIELDLVLQTAGPGDTAVHVLVDAPDRDAALASARAAMEKLYPDARLVTEGGREAPVADAGGVVRASWKSWGWTWDREDLPVPVYYNGSGAPSGFTEDALRRVLDTWSGVPGSSFAFAYRGTTTKPASMNAGGEDGLNVIAWQDLGCATGCVLGLTTKSFVTREVDISLNSNPGARLGTADASAYDTPTVLLHELGHVAGLEHSCPALGPCTTAETEAVMFWSYRGLHRQLEADDIAALVTLYPGQAVTPRAAGPVPGPGVTGEPSLLVSLAPGWNLTQLPAGPLDDVSAAMACVRAVYYYDAARPLGWTHWIRGLHPALQTLRAADGGSAYWVLSDASCSANFS